jgi:O-antigen/teichoic acid export membrane protein
MNEELKSISSIELRKNLITGAIAGGMLGVAFGIGFGSLWLGVIVGVLFGLAIGYRISRAPLKMRYPMHMIRRILLAGGFTILVGLVYAILLDRGWAGTPALLAALVPIAAWAFLVISLGMAIASLDELQRRIQTEAIAIGFAGTVIICGGVGLLGVAGILPAWNWGLVIFVLVFMWFIGKMWTLWRYR